MAESARAARSGPRGCPGEFSHLWRQYWVLALFVVASACRPTDTASGTSAAEPAVGRNVLRHAQTVRLERHAGFSVLTLAKPYRDAADSLVYVLVPRGHAPPPGYGQAVRIEVPVRRLALFAVPNVAMADALGAAADIVGVYDTAAVYAPNVRAQARAGAVRSLGGELDVELLLGLQPGLVMLSAPGAARAAQISLLQGQGIAVVPSSDYLEPTPLGRAEWLRVMGALLAKDSLADSVFAQMERAYLHLAAQTSRAPSRPKVVAGILLKDTWWLPGGRSYVARYLRDAGADYPWASDTSTGSFPASFEAVYPVAREADIWLNPLHQQPSDNFVAADPRFARFRSVRRGQVYGYYRRTLAGGANDYWESGVIRPDLVLADLVRILHPDLLPDHVLVYHKPLM